MAYYSGNKLSSYKVMSDFIIQDLYKLVFRIRHALCYYCNYKTAVLGHQPINTVPLTAVIRKKYEFFNIIIEDENRNT